MSDEKQRTEFEVWCCKRWGGDREALHIRDMPGSKRLGEYVNGHVQFAWQAWQAALASQPKPAPVLLTEPELERLCVEDEFLLYCSQDEFNEIAKTVQHAVLRKNGWGV